MDKIEELLTRGVANIIPGKKELEEKLQTGEKLNIYLGIDPTSTKIHLGHAVALRKLQAFSELGHNVTFLIGDFTALIGDTSDKDTERPVLSVEEIQNNFQTYKKQAEKILDFSKVLVKHNSEWLSKLTFEDTVKLTQHFSVGDFVGRELIRKRLSENKRVGLHEFLYPVMQGYDSYFMDTDIQIGGTDQTFNMQAGRTLQKDIRKKQSFVMTNVILEGTDGRKMSKSWGNAIWLDDTAEDIYAKVMAIKDELIIQYYTLATSVSMKEVNEAENALKKGEHPMRIKKQLAFEITKELTSLEEAEAAKESFEKRVQGGEKPEEMSEVEIEENKTVLEFLIENNFAESKSIAKRLVEQGGVTLDDKKIENSDQKIGEGILKIGKRRFVKIKTQK
ncbi:MAG TPA: tyrosine--tRNA ligase [Candidatus Saccharimonadales bacterium]|nr:tyrosine--tRNA ligase [Candidatus Saccharimonadales bacterium]